MNVAGVPGAGAALRLDGLTKRFGDFLAVDDLHLDIPEGSFFALLGPSGCGKTTTLRMVAGLEEPTSGRIILGDEDVTDRRPYKRPVNTVFQSYALFPHLDIQENVAFGLRRRGQKDIPRQVQETLDLVQLAGYERRRPSQLSGGQQQRVALARALINHPRVLLLDEPLGALDLKLRRQMQLELKRIQLEVGLTFVHVTHDQEEAMTMADTIAVMNAGRVEQLGDPASLYEFPATVFVANFLGQSNLVHARVTGRNGDTLLLDVAGQRLAMPADRSRATAESVLVGVRPEKIYLALAGTRGSGNARSATGDNELSGVVTDASFTGTSTQYLVRTPRGQELVVFAQNTSADRRSATPGDNVVLHWDPAHTFAFDGSGKAEAEEATAEESAAVPRVGVGG
jgi:spermidine/putrescine transport system ATP-binding protein